MKLLVSIAVLLLVADAVFGRSSSSEDKYKENDLSDSSAYFEGDMQTWEEKDSWTWFQINPFIKKWGKKKSRRGCLRSFANYADSFIGANCYLSNDAECGFATEVYEYLLQCSDDSSSSDDSSDRRCKTKDQSKLCKALVSARGMWLWYWHTETVLDKIIHGWCNG